MLGAVKWHYPINALIAYDMKASYTRYQSTFKRTVETVSDEAEEGKDALSRSYSDTRNAINDLSVNAAFSFTPSDQAVFRLGAQYTHHQFSPAENANQSTSLPTERETNPKVIANEWNCYVEGDIQAAPWLQFNAGLRGSFFRVEGKQYPVFEPRISANFRVSPTVSLKAGYAKMSQFVQQVSDNYISLPTDYWLPITRHFAPLTSHQVSAGIYVSPNKRYTFSLEGYYKKMSNLLEYKDNYKYMQTDSWEQTLCTGNGRAYGMDFQAEADFGNIQGFIGYGLMWSDRLFPELNGGRRFPSKYDNRHKVTLSATWRLSPRIELNAGWMFMTGNRATLSLENYPYPDGYPTDIVPTYPNKDEEMPNYYEGKTMYAFPPTTGWI